MKATIKQQIHLYKLLGNIATITENGIEDIVETLTWDKIIKISNYLQNGK